MSFRCEHCGFSNNEIQSAGVIRRKCNPTHQVSNLVIYSIQPKD
jgi:hypothetical protein